MATLDTGPGQLVPGDLSGVAIPSDADALKNGGIDFLTRALRAFGALGSANSVTRITRCEPCAGGSTGSKLFLSVEYARPEPGLHRDLFVKFSRDFNDSIRDDRGKYELDGEVLLAHLARKPGFPVRIPKVYFADQHKATHTGLLITECIEFGRDGLEPHHEKCLDHLLADPAAHYRKIMETLGALAAAHRSGRLGNLVEQFFPYDAAEQARSIAIPHSAEQLRTRVQGFAKFVFSAPQLFPESLCDASFFSDLEEQVAEAKHAEAEINAFLQHDPDMIALCHWNANIDNAYFWRDAAGDLQCGLMDWGRAGQMNVAFALWGCLSAAHHDVWDKHLAAMLETFVSAFGTNGGPHIAASRLELHLDLYMTIMGLQYFLDSPLRMLMRMPEIRSASGPRDPAFRHNETARNQLHISTVVMKRWQQSGPSDIIRKMRQQRPS